MRSPRHAAVLLAATGLLAAGLSAPAHAAPVFSSSDSDGAANYFNQSAVPCTVSNLVATPPANDVPVVENGPATTVTYSNSGRLSLNSDTTDFIDFASSITAKLQVKSSGGNPSTVTYDAIGTIRTAASKGTSACKVEVYNDVDLDADFTVTDPGFLFYDYHSGVHNYSEIRVTRSDSHYVNVYSEQSAWKGSGRQFVDPGLYTLYLDGQGWITGTSTTVGPSPVNIGLHLRYAKAGSALQKAKGKAKPYVKFPRARSCATHDVRLKTKSKASKASLVKLLVNGKVVKTIKNPKGGEKANLQVADNLDAAVVARVTLKPTKKGAKPVTVESSASYLACG